jgi:hypothetical protein
MPEELIAFIIENQIYPDNLRNVYDENINQATEFRINFLHTLDQGFNQEIFYVPTAHPLRKETLFYNFSYGCEGILAGTGLFESHFRSAFLHKDFRQVINYIYPGALRNFQHEIDLEEFCDRLFNYNIPGYKEALPIRLASYFYPNQLLPIFKIDHLEQICNSFGFIIEAQTKGEKLYAFNSFLKDQMEEVEGDNTIKMYICSQVHYAIDLRNRINNGECYGDISNNCRKKWIRAFYEKGMEILINLNHA